MSHVIEHSSEITQALSLTTRYQADFLKKIAQLCDVLSDEDSSGGTGGIMRRIRFKLFEFSYNTLDIIKYLQQLQSNLSNSIGIDKLTDYQHALQRLKYAGGNKLPGNDLHLMLHMLDTLKNVLSEPGTKTVKQDPSHRKQIHDLQLKINHLQDPFKKPITSQQASYSCLNQQVEHLLTQANELSYQFINSIEQLTEALHTYEGSPQLGSSLMRHVEQHCQLLILNCADTLKLLIQLNSFSAQYQTQYLPQATKKQHLNNARKAARQMPFYSPPPPKPTPY